MIVDDEEEIAQLMSETLELWGYNAITAQDGEEALVKFNETPIDIVITDLKLPKINGVSLVEKVKSLKDDTEVIMFTGYPEVSTAVNAMKNGASDYLVKPIDLDDLRVKIERAVDRKIIGHSGGVFHGINWAMIISVPAWLAMGIWLAYILRH
ncbi:response regulator [bacterium]|nr:response regulator [bacterium]